MNRLSISTLTGIDISSELLVHTFTSTDDGEIFFQLHLSGLAGDDTYRVCTTRQIGGAGTVYQSPTVGVGLSPFQTTITISTYPIPVQVDDVIKVYAIGVAADTSVNGYIEIFDASNEYDTALTTIDGNVDDIETILGTPDNFKADVSALALEATLTAIKGAGWTDETLVAIKAVIDGILTDTGTTLPATLTTIEGKVDTVDGIVDDILVDTGTTIPATIATMQADLDNPDQYKADVSALALQATLLSVVSSLKQYSVLKRYIKADQIEIKRSTDVSFDIIGVGDLTGRTKLYFTVKYMKEKDDATDAQSVIQIEETAGLLYINKTKADTPANGTLTVTDVLAGNITITLAAVESNKLLPNEAYLHDVKMDNSVMAEGRFLISTAITRTLT